MQPISFKNDLDAALAFDRQHIWHPYSSMTQPADVWPVESAKGVRLTLADGRQLIDGMSSWWSTIHGYGHPELIKTIQQQAEKMAHVMFGGLTHEPAIQLAQKLVDLTPEGLNHVFLADSGSVAVEVSIKMALQYQQARGKVEKHKLVSLRHGYHGDTSGCMSVCDPVTGMHHIFANNLQQHFFADAPQITPDQPWNESDLDSLKQILSQHHLHIAALIVEPIVQGAGGMRFYHPQYLKRARDLCNEFDVLLIADEIATGFGRSGKMFACEHANISPDILCLGKALTGGTMTLAATLATTNVANTISNGDAGCFMHGPTFMGNPLACAVANTSLQLLIESDWQANIQRLESAMLKHFAPARENPSVADVRVMGAIGVIEMKQPVDMKRIQPACIEKGIWVRPFGKLVYIMPAYVMSDQDIKTLCQTICEVLK